MTKRRWAMVGSVVGVAALAVFSLPLAANADNTDNHYQIQQADIFLPTINQAGSPTGTCTITIPTGNANSLAEYTYASGVMGTADHYNPGQTITGVAVGNTVDIYLVGNYKGISNLLFYFGATDPGPNATQSYIVQSLKCTAAQTGPVAETPPAPTQNGNVVTIPSGTDFTYSDANGVVTGDVTLTANITVTAAPTDPAKVSGSGSWNFTYTPPSGPVAETPATPTQIGGGTGNGVVIPTDVDFNYYARNGSQPVQQGSTLPISASDGADGAIHIIARPVDPTKVSGSGDWTFTYTAPQNSGSSGDNGGGNQGTSPGGSNGSSSGTTSGGTATTGSNTSSGGDTTSGASADFPTPGTDGPAPFNPTASVAGGVGAVLLVAAGFGLWLTRRRHAVKAQ